MSVMGAVAFIDGGGPLVDMWLGWSRFVSPVAELYGFLTPPVFTILLIVAFAGLVFLIRESSPAVRERLKLRRPAAPPTKPIPVPVPAVAETVHAGLLDSRQLDGIYRHSPAGNSRILVMPRAQPTARAMRCQGDLNFHLDRR